MDLTGCEGCGDTVRSAADLEDPSSCAADCGPQQVSAGGDFTYVALGATHNTYGAGYAQPFCTPPW